MIPATLSGRQRDSWQTELAQAISDPAQLLDALALDPALFPAGAAAAAGFRLRVPWAFVRRMRRGDARDPLLRQVLPIGAELADVAGFVSDPLGERAVNSVPGLLHKYRGRALLVTTGACAVHCRYCFRREFPYAAQSTDEGRWDAAIAAIAADRSIEEVILSGGDPLTLSNARLGALTDRLTAIGHVRRLRVHTRTPVVLPSRVDHGLVQWLAGLPRPVVVVHVNHAQEIDADVSAAFARLRACGATLLNQSVLLAGVNDDEHTLAALSSALWDAGVLPYYLHVLDRVRGAAHFDVPDARARELARGLAARLPGYLVPRLAREQAGAPGKTLLL